MKRRTLLCLLGLWLVPMQYRVLAAEFAAAAGKVEITPPAGVDLWGYSNRSGPATGALDPLYARALVLSDGIRRYGLVALDLGRTFGRGSMDLLRERVRGSSGIEQVYFFASHTHSGPVIDDAYPSGKPPTWEEAALARIAGLLEDTGSRLVPAAIAAGFGQTYLGHNRRWMNSDGTVKMLWRNATKSPTSPVDPTVGVIRIDDRLGKPIALLVNYACHPVIFGPDNLRYSADFPGAMSRIVEDEYGGTTTCMFLQGAAGDINPYMDKTPVVEGADRIVRESGEELGREVIRVSRELKPVAPPSPSLHARLDTLHFPVRWNLSKLFASLSELYGETTARRYSTMLSETVEAPVMTFLINREIALAGMPGEPFVEFQIDLRARSPLRNTFFIGYANGYAAYFPTLRAAVEGGYGANSLTTRAEVGAGETMINHILVSIYRMLGKLTDMPAR